MSKRPKRTPAPSWIYLFADDLETSGNPAKPLLYRIWQQTAPEATVEIDATLSKGKINQLAISSIDWTDEMVKGFLQVYFQNVGQSKLTRDNWPAHDPVPRQEFEKRCEQLRTQYGFRIDRDTGFHPPGDHFSAAMTAINQRLEIKRDIEKLTEAVGKRDGTIAVTHIFGLIQSIMKVKHPDEPFFGGNAPIHEKVKKSVSMLSLVDESKVKTQQVGEIGDGYANFVGRLAYLRNKHSQAHGLYEFDEDVFKPGILKSLAMFVIGFYFLHFED